MVFSYVDKKTSCGMFSAIENWQSGPPFSSALPRHIATNHKSTQICCSIPSCAPSAPAPHAELRLFRRIYGTAPLRLCDMDRPPRTPGCNTPRTGIQSTESDPAKEQPPLYSPDTLHFSRTHCTAGTDSTVRSRTDLVRSRRRKK